MFCCRLGAQPYSLQIQGVSMHVHIYENSEIDIANDDTYFHGQFSEMEEGKLILWKCTNPLDLDPKKPAYVKLEKPLPQRQVNVENWKALNDDYSNRKTWTTTRSLIESTAAVILDILKENPSQDSPFCRHLSPESNTASSSTCTRHQSNPSAGPAGSNNPSKIETSSSFESSGLSSSTEHKTPTTSIPTHIPTSPSSRNWTWSLAVTVIIGIIGFIACRAFPKSLAPYTTRMNELFNKAVAS